MNPQETPTPQESNLPLDYQGIIRALRELSQAGPTAIKENEELYKKLTSMLADMLNKASKEQENITKVMGLLQKDKDILARQIEERKNAKRPTEEEFIEMAGTNDPLELAEFIEEWEKKNKEELDNLIGEHSILVRKLDQLEVISKTPESILKVVESLEKGDVLNEKQLEAIQDLIKISTLNSEKLEKVKKNIDIQTMDADYARKFFQSLPEKIGEQLKSFSSLGQEMFGNEMMDLITKVGTLSKGVLQRGLNLKKFGQEMNERWARTKAIFMNFGQFGKGLKEGLGLGVSGEFASLVDANKKRNEVMKGIEKSTDETSIASKELTKAALDSNSIYTHDTHLERFLTKQNSEQKVKTSIRETLSKRWQGFMKRHFAFQNSVLLEQLKTSKFANWLSKNNFFSLMKTIGKGGLFAGLLQNISGLLGGAGLLGAFKGVLGKILTLGKGAIGAAAILGTAFDVGSNIINAVDVWKNPDSTTEQKGAATGRAVGSGAGAIAGGILGSFAGPLGTTVGIYIGNKVGGFVGEWVGEKIAPSVSRLWDSTKEFFANFGTHLSDLGSKVSSVFSSAWDSLKNIVSSGWDAVKNTGLNVIDKMSNFFSEKKEKIVNAYESKGIFASAWESIKLVNPIASIGEKAYEKSKDFISNFLGKEKDTQRITTTNDIVQVLNTNLTKEKAIPAPSVSVANKPKETPSEGLGNKLEALQEIQKAGANEFKEGMNKVVEAIQNIAIPAPIVTGQNIQANVPSDIDSLGILMKNKIWGTS